MVVNTEPLRASVNPQEFFGSPASMNSFARDVYTKTEQVLWAGIQTSEGKLLQRKLHRVHLPNVNVCDVSNDIATRNLNSDLGIPAKLMKDIQEGESLHEFSHVAGDNPSATNYVFDLAYKQFVPEEHWEHLSDYMIVAYNSPKELVEGLIAHQIPQFYHPHWLRPIFGIDALEVSFQGSENP